MLFYQIYETGLVNNCIYWRLCGFSPPTILRFELDTEKWSYIHPPVCENIFDVTVFEGKMFCNGFVGDETKRWTRRRQRDSLFLLKTLSPLQEHLLFWGWGPGFKCCPRFCIILKVASGFKITKTITWFTRLIFNVFHLVMILCWVDILLVALFLFFSLLLNLFCSLFTKLKKNYIF